MYVCVPRYEGFCVCRCMCVNFRMFVCMYFCIYRFIRTRHCFYVNIGIFLSVFVSLYCHHYKTLDGYFQKYAILFFVHTNF